MSEQRVDVPAGTRDGLRRRPVRETARKTSAEASGETSGETTGPLHWPSLAPFVAERMWPELAQWVAALRQRYRGLDSYVVPACWYEHESLVVALQALKDHERASYDASSPASSATDWHRAFRDVTALLRQFTADLRCGHGPEYGDVELFGMFIATDISRRRRRAATVALGLGDEDDTHYL